MSPPRPSYPLGATLKPVTKVKYNLNLFLGLLLSLPIFGQTISERLILSDMKDSLFLKSEKMTFDKEGNYCFIIKNDSSEYFVTKTDTFGPFKFIGSRYGNKGELNLTDSKEKNNAAPIYYQNANGTIVYKTCTEKIEEYLTSGTKENIGIVSSLNDSNYFFVNGKQVGKKIMEVNEKFYISNNDWCAFSNNGNAIYYVFQDSINILYVNGKQIDSSKFRYTQLKINDKGEYCFARGQKPIKPIGKYDYMFFIHSMDTVLGYVRTAWHSELLNNGAYYYSGDDNGPEYIAINNSLRKGISEIENIKLIDKQTFMYSFIESGTKKINVNGKDYIHNFSEIMYPSLDEQGNFAFYGIKDYYLYKYVKGIKESKPITKYGVRPTPLYINPTGESIHFFKTDDSIYFYRDNNLIFPPISKNAHFNIIPQNDLWSYNIENAENDSKNSLFFLEYDSKGYMVFNGKFSEPMFSDWNYTQSRVGGVVAGALVENGFFVIQKTGDSEYTININNCYYQKLTGVDKLVDDCFFFDGKSLVFYGLKGLHFYQYSIVI